MPKTKVQINFQASAEDAAIIDALSRADGYDNRSAWVRSNLRKVIDARRSEVTLPRPEGEQGISVQAK